MHGHALIVEVDEIRKAMKAAESINKDNKIDYEDMP
jgi:hypothetical protein